MSQCATSVVIVAVVVPVFTALTIFAIGRTIDFGLTAEYLQTTCFCQEGFTELKKFLVEVIADESLALS